MNSIRNSDESSHINKLTLAIDLEILKTKEFSSICNQVSQDAFLNYANRFKLIFIPNCSNENSCKHRVKHSKKPKVIQQIPAKTENPFYIEISGNRWFEALEISFLCITSKQYLSANVLKKIVDVMLDAQEDISSKVNINKILNKCKQVLALHFCMHPPCSSHSQIISVYTDFLTGPMEAPEKKSEKPRKEEFSMKEFYDAEKGIVQYCFRRLVCEVFVNTSDEPLVNKDKEIPNTIRNSVTEMHYKKEKLEIYETLCRTERIDRLMSVLDSIIELLQFDLFSHSVKATSRYKFLMSLVLWPQDGTEKRQENKITDVTKKVIKLFIYFIHLDYPEQHIQTIGLWLNTIIETLYQSADYHYYDYPSIGTFGNEFAKEFQNTMSVLSYESILKILHRLQPNYMKHFIGLRYTKSLLNSQEDNIIQIIITFLKNEQWKDFDEVDLSTNLIEQKEKLDVNQDNIIRILSDICKSGTTSTNEKSNINNEEYPKFRQEKFDNETNQYIVTSTMYITLMAYLESYNIQNVQKNLDMLNKNPNFNLNIQTSPFYMTTERVAKAYKDIYKLLSELFEILNSLKNEDGLPKYIKPFEDILKLQRMHSQ